MALFYERVIDHRLPSPGYFPPPLQPSSQPAQQQMAHHLEIASPQHDRGTLSSVAQIVVYIRALRCT